MFASTDAVAGASVRQRKFGDQAYGALIESGRRICPLVPIPENIEGHQAYPRIPDLSEVPKSVSFTTPPEVTVIDDGSYILVLLACECEQLGVRDLED
ncbi:CoA-binding protein [Rhodopirellula europaea]|uniref:CoA-binding protein n=1 Tax=Rhodopirellula europaea TaxID=1263866 RepID=UPI00068D9CA3